MRFTIIKQIMQIVLLSMLSWSVFATSPTNLVQDKAQIRQYVDSGQYTQDIAKVTLKAKEYLAKRIQENARLAHPQKLAIIFDIDETSLSNYADMVALDFGGTLKEIDQRIDNDTDPAITPTLSLYQYAKQQGVAVFFVTGRRESNRKHTEVNLKEAGYENWNGLYMKPEFYHENSAIPYKSATRKQITQQGYDVVFTLGDQQSDLSGGFADKTFLLPNPFYVVP